jgi:nucleoside-diphosphate-sugar epimerase
MKSIDIGSYHADWSRIARELGWKPRVRFDDGWASTYAFCKADRTAETLVPA